MSEDLKNSLVMVVSRAITGNPEDVDFLIRSYQKRLAAFVLGMVGNPSVVDDLLQTTFIKMALSLSKLRNPEQFERWLFQIARNVCMSHLRKKKVLKMFEPFRLGFHEKTEEQPSGNSSSYYEILQKGLGQLPPRQRELLCLMQQADYSYQELAEITGSTVSSVRNHLSRAKESIRRLAYE